MSQDETQSQSELIERLRKQAEETEALLHASRSAEAAGKESTEKLRSEISDLKANLEKQKGGMRDEEEKRTKAIALLKTVRQKLVKAEKERDDVAKEMNELKEKEKTDKTRERVEKIRFQNEIEQANLEREKAVAGLRVQFDKEVAILKDKQEKEVQASKRQFDSETSAFKNAHAQEVKALNDRIHSFESVNLNLTREKDRLFDELEMRQAELESSNTHLETLQSQTTEYQYQMRELTDRVTSLEGELTEAQREANPANGAGMSAEEVARLISAAEAKYEARLAELRGQLEMIEKERNEADAEWNSKVAAKALEVEELKKVIGKSQKSEVDHEVVEEKLRVDITALKEEVRVYQRQQAEFQRQVEKIKESEDALQMQLAEFSVRESTLEAQIQESKGRETQLRSANKTLREELRKVQSSAALLEKQRNPGAGYWASKDTNGTDSRTSTSSNSDRPTGATSPTNESRAEEEVNLEYLRNVILQFLEHKEMRPNLVRILTTILRFTPQETRRLSRSL